MKIKTGRNKIIYEREITPPSSAEITGVEKKEETDISLDILIMAIRYGSHNGMHF